MSYLRLAFVVRTWLDVHMTTADATSNGTMTYKGRTLRIEACGSLWQVTEATTVTVEYYSDGDTLEEDAIERHGLYSSKREAIAAAKNILTA